MTYRATVDVEHLTFSQVPGTAVPATPHMSYDPINNRKTNCHMEIYQNMKHIVCILVDNFKYGKPHQNIEKMNYLCQFLADFCSQKDREHCLS